MNTLRSILTVLTVFLMAPTSPALAGLALAAADEGLFGVEETLADATSVDVARLPDNWSVGGNDWLVVWEHRTSSVASEIRGQLYDRDGDPVGGSIVIASGDLRDPAVAAHPTTTGLDCFVVAWEMQAADGLWTVQVAAVDVAGSVTPVLDLADVLPPMSRRNPDVGTSFSDVTLVYEVVSTGIRRVSVSAGVSIFGDFECNVHFGEDVVSLGDFDVAPAIDGSHVSDGGAYCVWRRELPTGHAIVGRFARGSSSPEVVLAQAPAGVVLGDPDLASVTEDDHFAVWTAGPGLPDLRGRRIFSGAVDPYTEAPALGDVVTVVGGPTVAAGAHDPAIAGTDGQYTVAYRRSLAFVDSVRTVTLDPMTGAVLQELSVVPSQADTAPAVASSFESWLNDETRMLVVAPEEQLDWPYDHDLVGQFIETIVPEQVPLGGGCGDGGQIHLSAAVEGNPGFRIEVREAKPFRPTLLAVSTGSAELPLGAGTLRVEGASLVFTHSTATDAGGQAGVTIALPDGIDSTDLWFQALTLVGFGSCTGTGFDLSWSTALTVAPSAMLP